MWWGGFAVENLNVFLLVHFWSPLKYRLNQILNSGLSSQIPLHRGSLT